MSSKGKRDSIVKLLSDKENAAILNVIKLFHDRLSVENSQRALSNNRTLHEEHIDTLGRLLVGDETCAAIAIYGNKIYVSTNKINHTPQKLTIKLTEMRIKAGSTKHKMKIAIVLRGTTLTKVFHIALPEAEYNFDQRAFPGVSQDAKRLGTLHPQLKKQSITCEIPYEGEKNGHGIVTFPYPITLTICLGDMPGISFHGRLSQDLVLDNESTLGGRSYECSLDPLTRRAKRIFDHLGLLALFYLKDEPNLVSDFETVINQDRIETIKQIALWEIPGGLKGGGSLSKSLREYEEPKNTNISQKKEWHQRKKRLLDIDKFIDFLSASFTQYIRYHYHLWSLKRKRQARHNNEHYFFMQSAVVTVHKWRESVAEKIYKIPPISGGDLKEDDKAYVLKKFSSLLVDLLSLEKYICVGNPQFNEILASIGIKKAYTSNSWSTQDMCLYYPFYKEEAEIVIVDDLIENTHAELRLFKRIVDNSAGRRLNGIPYFGISLLCCANCHLFLKSHGVGYIEGQRHRAGAHGRHYADWPLDPSFRTEDFLRPFLGEECYREYESLSGICEYEGKEISKKAAAIAIIENLGALDQKDLSDLLKKGSKIWSDGSPYSYEENLGVKLNILKKTIETFVMMPIRGSDIREINSIMSRMQQNSMLVKEGLNKIVYIAARMGHAHPIYAAAYCCLSSQRKNVNFWQDAMQYIRT